MKKNIRLIWMVVCMVLILALGACSKDSGTESEEESTSTSAELESDDSPIIIIDDPVETSAPASGTLSRLTGTPIDPAIANRRPAAVMFNNIREGVPQSGIERASVVYEVPVEGGITRLMGIIEEFDGLDKIGAVRSCRLYFLYFAKEFDPIYVHWGQVSYADDLLYSSDIDNLSALSSLGTDVFYRSSDRVMPHNGYTSGDGILAGIEQLGYRKEYTESYDPKFQFSSTPVTLSNGSSALKVTPGYKWNSPWFEYNESDKLYYRFQYGGEQIDDVTGNQLTYKNIILQVNDYYDYGDGYYYVYTTGTGKGKYITEGKVIDITWEKDSDFAPTKYYDESGKEILLNTGKTWIGVIFEGQEGNIDIQ